MSSPGTAVASLSSAGFQPSPLEEERANPAFPVRQLTHFMDGGPEMTALREKIMLELERDPTFRVEDFPDLTRAQVRERIMQRVPVMAHYLSTESVQTFRLRLNYLSLIDPEFLTRIGVHFGLFMGAVTNSGTAEQAAHWLGKGAMTFGIIGCFGMTELGHGSNVAGVETTATFDPASDEFVIHTPTLTATKWWIGGAAESVTHCCVFAQLIVHGKNYGVKSFIVQVRDPTNFKLMPGVAIGDLGAKMGRNGIDNGWLQFTQVRIPRSHMLMRHTKVSREGKVIEPPIAQLTYGALIFGRVTMIQESADIVKKALIIALRYSAVRRQFATRPGAPESKILDYKTHQARLLPLLASAYAMHFGAAETSRIYDALMAKLSIAKPGDPSMAEAIEALKETHATCAGLKAFCSWQALDAIETCRQCIGGNGYSSYACLPGMYQDFAVQCTWEGDNTVLMLQAGRYLITCCREVKAGKKLPAGVDYLNRLVALRGRTCKPGPLDLAAIADGFDVVRARCVEAVATAFEARIKSGMNEDAAYEECSVQRLDAAKLHCIGYIFARFLDGVGRAPGPLKQILTDLCLLYGLKSLRDNSGAFLQYGYLAPAHIEAIDAQIFELYAKLRPQAIPLSDAFNYTDYIINTPLGCYDGDVYRRFFDFVRKQNPPKPHAYFESTIKPVLKQIKPDEDRLELDEEEETAAAK